MLLLRKAFLGLVVIVVCATLSARASIHDGKVFDGVEKLQSNSARSLMSKRRAHGLIQVRHLSRVMRMPSIGRHVFQSGNNGSAACEWDLSASECSLSPSTIVDFLPDQEAADSILNLMTCDAFSSRSSCELKEECIWEEALCTTTGSRTQDTLSKCFGSLEAFVRIYNLDSTCSKDFKERGPCNDADDCAWDEDEPVCGPDVWKILIGVPSDQDYLPQGFSKALEDVTEQATGQLADRLLSGVSPDDLFDVMSDSITCPEDVDPRVCPMTDLVFEHSKLEAFCAGKYGRDADGCGSDDRCSMDDELCLASDSSRENVVAMVLQGLIKDAKVAEFFGKTTACAIMDSESACLSPCVWDSASGCGFADEEIFALLAAATTGNDDLACQFLTAVLASGCPEAEGESECNVNESTDGTRCKWYPKDAVCASRIEFTINTLFKDDPDLAKELLDAESACQAAGGEQDCANTKP